MQEGAFIYKYRMPVCRNFKLTFRSPGASINQEREMAPNPL